jgi:hypothetical protein
MGFCIKFRFCLLSRKIKSLLLDIERDRLVLVNRSNFYHNGRLDVDSLLEEYSKERIVRIYQIKKELVKLRQIDKEFRNNKYGYIRCKQG